AEPLRVRKRTRHRYQTAVEEESFAALETDRTLPALPPLDVRRVGMEGLELEVPHLIEVALREGPLLGSHRAQMLHRPVIDAPRHLPRDLAAGSERAWRDAAMGHRTRRVMHPTHHLKARMQTGQRGSRLFDQSRIASTSTVMPRKSDGAPVQVPDTGMACVGSRVTATRTSFCPPTSALAGSNSTQPPPGRYTCTQACVAPPPTAWSSYR